VSRKTKENGQFDIKIPRSSKLNSNSIVGSVKTKTIDAGGQRPFETSQTDLLSPKRTLVSESGMSRSASHTSLKSPDQSLRTRIANNLLTKV
jgi:hypothetical protein